MGENLVGSVAAGLEAAQPILDVAGPPADFASANMAGAWKVTAARAAIKGRAGLEASDIEHVSDGEKLVSIRGHRVVLSFVGMQDVALRGFGSYSVPHSRNFIERQ
jgi:hypothetical protein